MQPPVSANLGKSLGPHASPGTKVARHAARNTIDEEDGVSKIQVYGPNKERIDAAVAKIRVIVAIPKAGETYEARIGSIMPYGSFVEFMPRD